MVSVVLPAAQYLINILSSGSNRRTLSHESILVQAIARLLLQFAKFVFDQRVLRQSDTFVSHIFIQPFDLSLLLLFSQLISLGEDSSFIPEQHVCVSGCLLGTDCLSLGF